MRKVLASLIDFFHNVFVIIIFLIIIFFLFFLIVLLPLIDGAQSLKGLNLVRCGTRNMFGISDDLI